VNCESVRDLLALSAAGALDAAGERRVAEHARECAPCAAELASLGEIAGLLGRLPAVPPSPGLVLQTQLLVAAEADRREGTRLAIAAVALAWAIAIATWAAGRAMVGPSPMWVWNIWCTAVAGIGSGVVALLVSRRAERNSL
jgi:predicted anti-sigma-YlaC factor YlaD